MYSLNVPVPSEVARLAGNLARELPEARPRDRGAHTLVVKRLSQEMPLPRLQAMVRERLRQQPPFTVRVTDVDVFEEAVAGPSPVVYLSIESQQLRALHERLSESFPPADGIEGEAYVPHVTVARGGSQAAAARLAERSIESHTWTVARVVLRDAQRDERVGRVTLSA